MEVPLEEEDSTFTNISLADDSELLPEVLNPGVESSHTTMMNADMDAVEAENQVELEEKTRLINQVLELQHTLEDLSARVDAVKEENLKLKSENQVLGQYIENLMSASSVFQTTDTKSKRKSGLGTLVTSIFIPFEVRGSEVSALEVGGKVPPPLQSPSVAMENLAFPSDKALDRSASCENGDTQEETIKIHHLFPTVGSQS
ncbi:hypothetical protein KIL84_001376 [Mauremys mutica]|uniref:Short coiled-coil protein n=2 Tax=Mauremys mutica TaxID=74926 RepID=A0A9D3WZ14_9SAUR|nr:hypothetical protein KIL84_001376 [Mauremys mutica]